MNRKSKPLTARGRPTSVPPPGMVKVIMMRKTNDFLYPDWMGYVSMAGQREPADLSMVYTPQFRPGRTIKRPEMFPFSNSTPSAALSNAELLYGPEGSRSSHANGDDLGGSSDFAGGYERERQRLRDLDVGSNSNNSNGSNKRPSSRNRQQRAACSVVEKVSFDRERDEGRALTNSLPVKAPNFRSNGLRSTLVRGEQLLAQRGNGSNSGREPEDLIAMGTLWNPAATSNNNNSSNNNNNNNNLSGGSSNTRSSSTTTTSNKSATNNNNNNGSGSNTTVPAQRKPVSVAMNTSMRLHHSSSTGNLPFNGGGLGRGGNNTTNNSHNNKEVEPKYPDPILGATASFQQRLMELAALEAETIRWERTKKVKKKPRPDRDS